MLGDHFRVRESSWRLMLFWRPNQRSDERFDRRHCGVDPGQLADGRGHRRAPGPRFVQLLLEAGKQPGVKPGTWLHTEPDLGGHDTFGIGRLIREERHHDRRGAGRQHPEGSADRPHAADLASHQGFADADIPTVALRSDLR